MTDSRTTMTKRLAVLLNDDHKHSPHETTSLLQFLFTILYLMTEFLFLNNFAKGWKVSWKVVRSSPYPGKARCGDTKSIFSDYKIKLWKYGTLSLNCHELQENGLFFRFTGPYQTYRNTCVGVSFWYSCRPAGNFIEKRLQHKCFLIVTAKFLRIPVLKNICERLLLTYTIIIFQFFSKKGRLPQILPGPFLNTLTHLTQS